MICYEQGGNKVRTMTPVGWAGDGTPKAAWLLEPANVTAYQVHLSPNEEFRITNPGWKLAQWKLERIKEGVRCECEQTFKTAEDALKFAETNPQL
jgi:hypothetical protein